MHQLIFLYAQVSKQYVMEGQTSIRVYVLIKRWDWNGNVYFNVETKFNVEYESGE